jgi:hypothetical protein
MPLPKLLKSYALRSQLSLRRYRQVIRHPGSELEGRRLLATLRRHSEPGLRIDRRSAWTRFDARTFAGAAPALELLGSLIRRWAAEQEPRRVRQGGCPIDLLLPEDLLAHPAILQFALHDQFLRATADYLGQVPRLYHLRVWWSPPSESLDGSRQFHYDHRDRRQVKIFVNLDAVDEAAGPLHFLGADDCARFDAQVGYRHGRIRDEEVYGVCPREHLRDSCGEAGTGVIVDTARCLHYGSRLNTRDRLMLAISYVRANSALPNPSPSLDPIREQFAAQHFADDPVRRFALTAPAF